MNLIKRIDTFIYLFWLFIKISIALSIAHNIVLE